MVSSGAAEEDLTWGRQMIRTWRLDLLINELVVSSTSSCDNTYKNVLTGG